MHIIAFCRAIHIHELCFAHLFSDESAVMCIAPEQIPSYAVPTKQLLIPRSPVVHTTISVHVMHLMHNVYDVSTKQSNGLCISSWQILWYSTILPNMQAHGPTSTRQVEGAMPQPSAHRSYKRLCTTADSVAYARSRRFLLRKSAA